MQLGAKHRWPPGYWTSISWRTWLAYWIVFRDEIRERAREAERQAGHVRPEDARADPKWGPPPQSVLDMLPDHGDDHGNPV